LGFSYFSGFRSSITEGSFFSLAARCCWCFTNSYDETVSSFSSSSSSDAGRYASLLLMVPPASNSSLSCTFFKCFFLVFYIESMKISAFSEGFSPKKVSFVILSILLFDYRMCLAVAALPLSAPMANS
jgi:hypothetical protein